MKDVEIIGLIKTYVNATLIGMGALKGAPCQCEIVTNADGTHTVTMKWIDNEGDAHTDDFTVLNGQVGDIENLGDVVITSLADGQVLAWDSDTSKWVNVSNSATVNSLDAVGDVTITSVQNGQTLVWDSTANKWVNANLLALGETSSTAYRGDRGKAAYDHSQLANGTNPHATTADNVNLATALTINGASKTTAEAAISELAGLVDHITDTEYNSIAALFS